MCGKIAEVQDRRGTGGLPASGGIRDDVAAKLVDVADAGFAGCTITFVDYLNEFPFFVERVLPRLEREGVRKPAEHPALN